MTIYGVDTSDWQHGPNKDIPIDWNAVKAAGNDFAIIKATEGDYYVNPFLGRDSQESEAAGLINLFYHFAANTDAVTEANYFLRAIAPLQVGEGMVLDQERGGNVLDFSTRFLDYTALTADFNPFIYLNGYYSNFYNWSAVAAKYPLWFADYSYNPTVGVPAGYWDNNYAMQQYTDKASVPGIIGPVDRNVFFGSRDQLLALCKKGAPAPVPPPPAPIPSGLGDMKNLVLGLDTKDGISVYVGDGVTRRAVADPLELSGLQYWIHLKGGDPTVYPFDDLRVLGHQIA